MGGGRVQKVRTGRLVERDVAFWRRRGSLFVGAVEVVVWTTTEIGEALHVPEVGTEVCEVVDIEVGVDEVDCNVDLGAEIAA